MIIYHSFRVSTLQLTGLFCYYLWLHAAMFICYFSQMCNSTATQGNRNPAQNSKMQSCIYDDYLYNQMCTHEFSKYFSYWPRPKTQHGLQHLTDVWFVIEKGGRIISSSLCVQLFRMTAFWVVPHKYIYNFFCSLWRSPSFAQFSISKT